MPVPPNGLRWSWPVATMPPSRHLPIAPFLCNLSSPSFLSLQLLLIPTVASITQGIASPSPSNSLSFSHQSRLPGCSLPHRALAHTLSTTAILWFDRMASPLHSYAQPHSSICIVPCIPVGVWSLHCRHLPHWALPLPSSSLCIVKPSPFFLLQCTSPSLNFYWGLRER